MTTAGQTADALSEVEGGKLAENIMHFARVLRRAGLPVGPGQVLDAIEAVQAAGIGMRSDFYWTLHSVFVNSRQQRVLFDQAFHVFWRKPGFLEQMMEMMLPQLAVPVREQEKAPGQARLAEAMFGGMEDPVDRPEEEVLELEASLTFSAQEVLRKKDFEQMTVDEQAQAKAAIARLKFLRRNVRTRRFRRDPAGARIDLRATMRDSLRHGGRLLDLKRKQRRTRTPPLVVLCDISGSMTTYSRMFLHFMHALASDRDRITSFLFGTRLTNITRHLERRDVDEALDKVSDAVADWSGGTRIGESIRAFNYDWSRRCLGQGAEVLLITDGLDRDDVSVLEVEIDRLHRSCRRLTWLNPLLRYDEFEPKAAGIRAILPHVDAFRPVHNLESLEDLANVLSDTGASARRSAA